MSTQAEIVKVTTAMQQLLLEKNKRYGDSALNPPNVFSKLNGADSICIRLDDKINRIKNATELKPNDICDIIGYCTLLLISKGVTEEDILNQID